MTKEQFWSLKPGDIVVSEGLRAIVVTGPEPKIDPRDDAPVRVRFDDAHSELVSGQLDSGFFDREASRWDIESRRA